MKRGTVTLLALSCVVWIPDVVVAQAKPDTLGPGVAWQLRSSGEAGTITGIVFSSDGAPLKRVGVRIDGQDRGVQSDASGRFAVAADGDGSVTVVVERIGYHTVRESVTVPSNRGVFFVAILRPAVIRISGGWRVPRAVHPLIGCNSPLAIVTRT